MTTSYTPLLGLALPVTGELAGVWGDTVSNYITKYLDSAVAGVQTISGTQTAVTLSVTNGSTLSQAGALGTTGSAQYQIINCTGNPAGLLTITVPAQSKVYLVLNATSTSQSVKVVGAGPTTGVTIISGEKALVAWNGSDFVKVATAGGSSTFSNVTVTGTTTLSGLTASTALALDASKNVVSVTNTGTGNNVLSASPTLTGTVGAASLTLSSLTSGRVTYAGASGLLQDSANLTFDGTTLTAANITSSGTWTFSGGTANGVLYLNASKVATSGSALTFDGNRLAVAGSSASTNRVDILNDNGNATFRIGYDTSNNLTITRNTGDANIYLNATQSGAAQVWQLAGSEQMRLTSTGLGVGTSSPGAKLHVYTSASTNQLQIIEQGLTSRGAQTQYKNLYNSALYIGISGDTNGDAIYYNTANSKSLFYNNSTLQMTLDSSGNLGIGTSSPSVKLDVNGICNFGAASGVRAGVGTAFLAGQAEVYAQGSVPLGIGTAGAQPMRMYTNSTLQATLDSSGNLGLGVTPSAWSNMRAMDIGDGSFAISADGAGSGDGSVTWNGYYNGTNWIYKYTGGVATRYRQNESGHAWFTAPSGTAGNAISFTQAMTLDASGNLAIGRTSASATLDIEASGGASTYWRRTGFSNRGTINVDGTNATLASEGALLFGTGSGFTERARIDSSGRLLVGTTSVQNSATCTVLSATSVNSVYAAHNSDTSGDNSFIWFGTEAGGTTRGSITYNRGGGVVAYNTTSDYRAKDIIGPVVDPGATIDALKVYMGKMKGATIERPMMIAHEAQAVVSYSVTGEKDAVNEDGTPKYQQMDHQVLVPLLIAELQSLRKRVAQLEGK